MGALDARIRAAYGNLPLSFEANEGQTDPEVKFLVRGSGYTLFLTSSEAVFSLHGAGESGYERPNRIHAIAELAEHKRIGSISEIRDGSDLARADVTPPRASVLRLQLVGSNPAPRVVGERPLPGKVSYFIGNDPTRWHPDVSTYARVVYRNVYPGIDLAYYGNQGQLEYDFLVAPGADPSVIALRYAGAEAMKIDAQGNLVLRVAGYEISQKKPFIYQDAGDVRTEVSGDYLVPETGQVRFALATYDRGRPLVIDPVLVFSTYLGGSGLELPAFTLAVDHEGHVYLAGRTLAHNFPTTPGAFQRLDPDPTGLDVYVTKLASDGSALVYSTYLGGTGRDSATSIAVDEKGRAYIAGNTRSSDFPTTAGAFQETDPDPAPGGAGTDGFVTKLNPSGSALVYSTYLGGTGVDIAFSVAPDEAGNAYVCGWTGAPDFPTTPNAFQSENKGGLDGFVAKVNPSGSALVYSTYFGGSGDEFAFEVGLSGRDDDSGRAYVSGDTGSTDFPTTAGAFDRTYNGGPSDAFVIKLNEHGSRLVYSTYLGGSGNDFNTGLAVDRDGHAYAAGSTDSTNFPTTRGSFQSTDPDPGPPGTPDDESPVNADGFVTKLSRSGSRLVYSTYLGGNDFEAINDVSVDKKGRALVTGGTDSTDFPTTSNAFQPTDPDPGPEDPTTDATRDAFVTLLNDAGSDLIYSTYLGGLGADAGTGTGRDEAGNLYVTGRVNASDFPTTPGAFQPRDPDPAHQDSFVAKFSLDS